MKGHAREIVLSAILVIVLFYFFRPTDSVPTGGPATEDAGAEDPVARLVGVLEEFGSIEEIVARAGDDYEAEARNLFDYGKPKPTGPSAEELARREAERLRRAEEARRAAEEAERLRLEALKRQQQEQQEAARNAARELTPPPPAKPVPPSLTLKYIGVVGAEDDKIAIFLDGEQFVLAREGETVKEDFRVEQISYDTLQMGFTDPQFADERRIMPMGG